MKALELFQKKAGKLGLAQAMAPAITAAELGVPVSYILSKRIERTREKLALFPETASLFLDQNQAPLKQGAPLVQKDLARTLRGIAKGGSDYFYRGEFAQKVSRWMALNGGIIDLSDFEDYEVVWRKPVESMFYGYRMLGFPPPSSGGVHVSQILSMLELLGFKTLSQLDQLHVLAEAMQLAFSDRAHWLGDPDFTKIPLALLERSYLQQRVDSINLKQTLEGVSFGTPTDVDDFFSRHTTHLSVADKQGNWVAITATVNTSFGSKVVVPGTGVVLNNQMDDFSIQPGVPNAFGLVGNEANAVAPRKRPLSSMSPTLVFKEGMPVMSVGAAGGPTIITQVVQLIVNTLLLGMPLDQAIAAPRIHQQWRPELLFMEKSFSDNAVKAMKKRGHEVKLWSGYGASQAIFFDGEQFYAESEPRLFPSD